MDPITVYTLLLFVSGGTGFIAGINSDKGVASVCLALVAFYAAIGGYIWGTM